ncbi:RT0821/Lpp0805 family surface protein [Rhizobium wenxiniae]|uniref:RT0821/Lpp0805 family surface protein n=1 Tax=Rhizobium wenxiniae TaxID=1737357 RepID=UPI003D337190
MSVIAKWTEMTKCWGRKGGAAICLATLTLSLAGCTSSLDLFGGSSKVDRSLATGTVAGKPQSETSLSDEATVRNAVTSADLAKMGNTPLPWANAATGSAGVVSVIQEDSAQGRICRAFKTTRHSYEGIAVFAGQTCMTGSGDWMLTAFDRQG